jgi:hypothetical protein
MVPYDSGPCLSHSPDFQLSGWTGASRRVTTVPHTPIDMLRFQRPNTPPALCLTHTAYAGSVHGFSDARAVAREAKADAEAEVDAVRLYISELMGVIELDLSCGQQRSWGLGSVVTALTVADDGVRVFVASDVVIRELNTRTGMATLMVAPDGPSGWVRDTVGSKFAVSGMTVDRMAGALLLSDSAMHGIMRLCGIRPERSGGSVSSGALTDLSCSLCCAVFRPDLTSSVENG